MTTRHAIAWLAWTATAALLPAALLSAALGAEVALPHSWRPTRQPPISQGELSPRGEFASPRSFPSATNAPQPHPAVVRVIAPERGGTSLGSGTLVAIRDDYGIVVTNWHVVRDASEPVIVVFPGGFRSLGRVLKTDRDWDLAAVAIDRPDVEPVSLSIVAPRAGDFLTIAGYGAGSYRAATGRCTQYLSPGRRLPFEMVEFSTAARQGDSGGPIFNDCGELAGVLFGAGSGTTSGSYCLRVAEFLAPVLDAAGAAGEPVMVAARAAHLKRLPPPPRLHPSAKTIAGEALAGRYPTTFAPDAIAALDPPSAPLDGPVRIAPQFADWRPTRGAPSEPEATAETASSTPEPTETFDDYDRYERLASDDQPAVDQAALEPDRDDLADDVFAEAGDHYVPLPQGPIPFEAATEPAALTASLTPRQTTETIVLDVAPSEEPPAAERQDLTWHDVAGTSPWDQAKTVLAVLGAIALALHGLRWMKMV